MQKFSEYILNEKDFYKKISTMEFVSKKAPIFFDKSVIFKAMIAKMFIETMKLDVDENLVTTACLLYACKKSQDAQSLEKVKSYGQESADFLKKLGFSDRFCKICLEHNRYNDSQNREKESDILELVDQLGGMMVDREERRGFPLDEAIVLIEHRNLKNCNNVYLEQFKEFINKEMDIIVWLEKENYLI